MKDELRFMELLGGIDMELISQAGQPWVKKRMHIKMFQIKVACAILIVLLGLSCAFHTEVKAALEKFTTTIGQLLGIKEDISPYTQIINAPITKNGMTITLKEVILDQDEIAVSFSAKMDNSQYKEPLLWNDIWIDGHKLVSQKTFKSDDEVGELERDYVIAYRLGKEIELDETVNIKILFRPTDSQNEQLIGKYEFSFNAARTELATDTVNLPLKQEIAINDGKSIRLNKFTWNSIESSIIGECEDLPLNTDYYLKGEDNLGNQVEYWKLSYISPEITFVKYVGDISPKASSLELQVYLHYDTNMKIINSEEQDDITLEDSTGDDAYQIEPFGEKFTIQIKDK